MRSYVGRIPVPVECRSVQVSPPTSLLRVSAAAFPVPSTRRNLPLQVGANAMVVDTADQFL